ncbi:MAG: transcription regulator Fur family [Actinomycetia bacterium]|nr:transcription regulator Fur family [Actinomycetes bacterium]
MQTPAELTQRFRARGLKVTPQREAVFRALVDNVDHPTAESVHATVTAAMPSVSLRTVYQVLNDLASMGEINALDLGLGAARFDPNVDTHHHLVCVECGKVRDVYVEPVAVPVTALGFTVDSAEVVFRGRCDDCAPVLH